MSKFTFKMEEAGSNGSTKTVEFNALALNNVVQEFELFLKCCGYGIDGHLKVVDDIEHSKGINITSAKIDDSTISISGFSMNEGPSNNYLNSKYYYDIDRNK